MNGKYESRGVTTQDKRRWLKKDKHIGGLLSLVESNVTFMRINPRIKPVKQARVMKAFKYMRILHHGSTRNYFIDL